MTTYDLDIEIEEFERFDSRPRSWKACKVYDAVPTFTREQKNDISNNVQCTSPSAVGFHP